METIIAQKVRKASIMVPAIYGEDDIAQEMRIACWRGLNKFDISRVDAGAVSGVIKVFFRKCIDNRIYNLRRSVYLPNNPPCNRCQYWQNKECIIAEYGCHKIENYRATLRRRQELDKPSELKMQRCNTGHSDIDLNLSIESKLEPEVLNKYKKLLLGETIDDESLEIIRFVTKEILDERD